MTEADVDPEFPFTSVCHCFIIIMSISQTSTRKFVLNEIKRLSQARLQSVDTRALMNASRKAAIYARVSTNRQSCDNQLTELRRVAETAGWTIVAEFIDQGVSGSKHSGQRPALDRLMQAATRREFDVLLVWSIDRLGRSLQHLVELMNDLHRLGTDLFFHQQAIDTTTATGKLAFSIFGALAEYERSMIRERVIAGQQRARAQGTKLGRPTKLNDSVRSAVSCLRERGMSIASIARRLEIGVGTVYKCLGAGTSH